MGYTELTELLLEKLQIEWPPVALTFVPEPPAQVPVMGKEAPSFCTFWRWGERALFYAPAEQHLGCAIGGMVAGFPLPEERQDEVYALLDEMCAAEGEESTPDEVAQTARVTRPAAGVVYGPLWLFPFAPDVVVVWATVIQAAVLQEVAGPVMWRNNPQGAAFTRPACSALPIAMAHGKPAMSLGCTGMRSYTQIPEGVYLLALPGSRLEQLEQDLRRIEDPGGRLQFYYEKLRAGMAQEGPGA